VDFSQEKLLSIGIVMLLTISGIATFVYYKDNYGINSDNGDYAWIDPVTEITDPGNHTHNDIMQHYLKTNNMTLIDYHNLNCDGNTKPPADLDNTAGRPCSAQHKNTAPTPGDNSEVVLEGDFPECIEGCYAYVAAYNQFHILDIREPNNIQMLSTYYAEVARIIDIKVTNDNNWVLINHELTNSELDPIPNDDDANSGMNRLDLIDVSDKKHPIKRAEWNNPPAGFHNQDIHVYCNWDDKPITDNDQCQVFLFGADPYPEINGAGLYKGTQIFYAPDGLESFIVGENESKEIIRWGGYSPDPDTTCGGTVFNHDNIIHRHPITDQILLYAAYWDAGLRILDVSNPPAVADPFGLTWPQNNEIGHWMGCPDSNPSDDWYSPEGGGHAGMSADKWTDAADGNGNIHYVVPYDHLICEGIYDGSPKPWPAKCGTGYEDPEFRVNWRHYTLIAPEFGSNDNHTGWIWTIDTTDPTKPFLVSKWRLPGTGMKEDGTEHPQHYIPGGYIYSPHNGDTGLGGNVYWAHYHAGSWVTGHDQIWGTIAWKDGIVAPEQGWQAIEELGRTESLAYYLPHGPDWIDNATNELQYDMADCWASCMIPFDWGLQYDPRGYIFISEMVSGLYVVQYDGDKQADYLFPPLYNQ
jgi:hypothetical protein